MSVENDTNARGVILAPPHQTAEILALLDDLSAVMHALCYELQELRRAIDEKSQTVLPRKNGGRDAASRGSSGPLTSVRNGRCQRESTYSSSPNLWLLAG